MSFKGISERFQSLGSKLWFNVFLRVVVIFAVFVLVLTLANGTMLVKYFSFRQKKMLIAQTQRVAQLDISDSTATRNMLSEIREKHNFDVEIYNSQGRILFTTHGGQMMDFFANGHTNFVMSHEELEVVESEKLSNGIIFVEAHRRFDNDRVLLCRKEIASGVFAELRVQKELITESAQTANEFIIIISLVCLALSVVWIFVFARKFSRPISKMNEITHQMAKLDFSRRLEYSGRDEIGQLAMSVNLLSDSLSKALSELEVSNARLRDEIEMERRLDAMRRGFVANVSHELKTPISIISGYAQGLKLNVKSDSKDEYCDIIIDESDRMNSLVLSILELSRYESGQMPQRCEYFDVSVLADTVLKRIFVNSGIDAVCEIPSETVIYADSMQIEQILKAYLENALSHTNKGGRVRVSGGLKQDKYCVSVFNTGENIPEDKFEHIWESFYRGDTSHKRDESRFGLGLSIVSAIVKNSGCECGVYNTAEGVCFWFTCNIKESQCGR